MKKKKLLSIFLIIFIIMTAISFSALVYADDETSPIIPILPDDNNPNVPVEPDTPPVNPVVPPVNPVVPPTTPNVPDSPNINLQESNGGELEGARVDLSLSNLSISCGNLYPAFSPTTYDYTVYVNMSDNSPLDCSVSYQEIDQNVSVNVSGPDEITKDDVIKKVKVSDDDGNSLVYTIKIHIIKEDELFLNETLYVVNKKPEISLLPGKFKVKEIKVGKNKFTAAVSPKQELYMIQYQNPNNKKDSLWYAVLPNSEKLLKTEILDANGKKEIVIFSDNEKLVYADGKQGLGLYRINPKDGSRQLLNDNSKEDKSSGIDFKLIGILVLGIIAIVGISCFILFKVKKRKKETKVEFKPYLTLEADEETMKNMEE